MNLIEELNEIKLECSTKEYSEDGSLPVSDEIFQNSVLFAECIPKNYSRPTIGVSQGGDIIFEWIGNPGNRVAIQVCKTNKLLMAWINGEDSGSETLTFIHPYMPRELRYILNLMNIEVICDGTRDIGIGLAEIYGSFVIYNGCEIYQFSHPDLFSKILKIRDENNKLYKEKKNENK